MTNEPSFPATVSDMEPDSTPNPALVARQQRLRKIVKLVVAGAALLTCAGVVSAALRAQSLPVPPPPVAAQPPATPPAPPAAAAAPIAEAEPPAPAPRPAPVTAKASSTSNKTPAHTAKPSIKLSKPGTFAAKFGAHR